MEGAGGAGAAAGLAGLVVRAIPGLVQGRLIKRYKRFLADVLVCSAALSTVQSNCQGAGRHAQSVDTGVCRWRGTESQLWCTAPTQGP